MLKSQNDAPHLEKKKVHSYIEPNKETKKHALLNCFEKAKTTAIIFILEGREDAQPVKKKKRVRDTQKATPLPPRNCSNSIFIRQLSLLFLGTPPRAAELPRQRTH